MREYFIKDKKQKCGILSLHYDVLPGILKFLKGKDRSSFGMVSVQCYDFAKKPGSKYSKRIGNQIENVRYNNFDIKSLYTARNINYECNTDVWMETQWKRYTREKMCWNMVDHSPNIDVTKFDHKYMYNNRTTNLLENILNNIHSMRYLQSLIIEKRLNTIGRAASNSMRISIKKSMHFLCYLCIYSDI